MDTDTLKNFTNSTIRGGIASLLTDVSRHFADAGDLSALLESISRDLTDVALVENAMQRGAMLAELQGQLKLLLEIERIRINDEVLTRLKEGLKLVLDTAVTSVGALFTLAAKAGVQAAMGLSEEK